MKLNLPIAQDYSDGFVIVAKSLLNNSLYHSVSPDAALLYAYIQDRTSLSMKNGWTDKNGRIFVYYPVSEVAELMKCGHDKATRLLKELEKAHLITRKRMGQGKSSRIFLHPFQPSGEKSSRGNTKIERSKSLEIPAQDIGFSDGNNTERNNTEKIYTDSATTVAEQVKEQISYPVLLKEMSQSELDGIVNIIADVLSSTASTIRIFGTEKNREEVCRQLEQLDDMDIRYVKDRLEQEQAIIKSPKSYILARLLEAKSCADFYYRSRVNHDFSNKPA